MVEVLQNRKGLDFHYLKSRQIRWYTYIQNFSNELGIWRRVPRLVTYATEISLLWWRRSNHWGNVSGPFRHNNLQRHLSLNLAFRFPWLLCHAFLLLLLLLFFFLLSIISLDFSACFGCHLSKSRELVSICENQLTYGLVNTSKGRNPSSQYQLSSSNHFLALIIALASRFSNDI